MRLVLALLLVSCPIKIGFAQIVGDSSSVDNSSSVVNSQSFTPSTRYPGLLKATFAGRSQHSGNMFDSTSAYDMKIYTGMDLKLEYAGYTHNNE